MPAVSAARLRMWSYLLSSAAQNADFQCYFYIQLKDLFASNNEYLLTGKHFGRSILVDNQALLTQNTTMDNVHRFTGGKKL